jgi:hypothetical protein
MPIASSDDMILASLEEIHDALKAPYSESPLPSIAHSTTEQIRQLSSILQQRNKSLDKKEDELDKAVAFDLSFQPPTVSALRVPMDPIEEETRAPTATQTRETYVPATDILVPVFPTELRPPPGMPPLRVETIIVEPDSSSNPTVTSDLAAPTALPPPTYHNSTGPSGKRRRQQMRNNKPRAIPTAMRLSITNPVIPIVPPKYSANLAYVATQNCNNIYHWALHGNAFNPDTGQLAEYLELSKCTEGQYWIDGNGDEIGRLAQGRGTKITGTDTMFFIPFSDIPKGKKCTYVNIVVAYRPEKE